MIRRPLNRTRITLGLALLLACLGASPAHAAFGIHDFDVAFIDQDGNGQALAGSHPYTMRTSFKANLEPGPVIEVPEGAIKDLEIAQIPGFIGDQTAVPKCSTLDFLVDAGENASACADSAAVGTIRVEFTQGEVSGVAVQHAPLYNLEPTPGTAARLGFSVANTPVTVAIGIEEEPPYRIVAQTRNISQGLEFYGAEVNLWGVPADPVHDPLRGGCLKGADGGSKGKCTAGVPPTPFLTLPRNCDGPLATTYELDSWQNPGLFTEPVSVLTHDDAVPPNPQGMLGCGDLVFNPGVTAQPTTKAAQSPTGLDIGFEVNDEGLQNPEGRAQSELEKAIITLPEGMTANPSLAEGLEVCSEADLKGETSSSAPGAGCPEAAKIGTVEVESPLVDQLLKGSLYIAEPYNNRFGSLLAMFIVIKNAELGVDFELAVRIEPDPETGQLVATSEDIPRWPFSNARFHFREGGRSPLISPPSCGTHTLSAELYPRSGGAPIAKTSSFRIISGPNEGPCPPGGAAPFAPGFEAGTVNNAAGAYSPFHMRLTRKDGEQDMTRFDSVLPPGVLGKLAGLTYCPEAAIAAAKSKTGLQEKANPSCPDSSKIGRSVAGAGVGSQLTYVPGGIYLAGPVAGDPLSVVAITPAVAGPFDAGTVVVREALTLNSKTAEVEVDGAASDPIPHILKGIPLNLRDLRVYVDRPRFTLNATDCDESQARATLFGSNLLPLNPADDLPTRLSARYQAAGCASLGFKPRLAFDLKGGTKRGGHPALTATYTPRAGDANLAGLVTRLPRSAFLDQAHIRTICTRVQFAANACPAGAQYGRIKAFTPLLDTPLEGPVYLRSSDHNLPDLVFDLHGLVDVEVATRIDSVKGGIRATVEDAPDAPLSKVVLQMQGAKKGLIVNSRDLCAAPSRANVQFSGQNGKRYKSNPVLRAGCGGKAQRQHKRHRSGAGR